jgi:hypothetical protein
MRLPTLIYWIPVFSLPFLDRTLASRWNPFPSNGVQFQPSCDPYLDLTRALEFIGELAFAGHQLASSRRPNLFTFNDHFQVSEKHIIQVVLKQLHAAVHQRGYPILISCSDTKIRQTLQQPFYKYAYTYYDPDHDTSHICPFLFILADHIEIDACSTMLMPSLVLALFKLLLYVQRSVDGLAIWSDEEDIGPLGQVISQARLTGEEKITEASENPYNYIHMSADALRAEKVMRGECPE